MVKLTVGFSRHSRGRLQPSLLLLLACAVAPCGIAGQTVPTKLQATHKPKLTFRFRLRKGPPLTFITPADPRFDGDVDAYFPGFTGLPTYEELRPFLIILRNDNSVTARAYAVRWELEDNNGVAEQYLTARSITTPLENSVPLEDTSIKAGEARLLSPLFNWGTLRFDANFQHPDTFAKLYSPEDLPPPTSYAAIVPQLDSVVYANGEVWGADKTGIWRYYFFARAADHDEVFADATLLASSPTSEQVMATLRRRILRARGWQGGPLVEYVRDRALAAMRLQEILKGPHGYARFQNTVEQFSEVMPPFGRLTSLGEWYAKRFADHDLGPRAKQRGVE